MSEPLEYVLGQSACAARRLAIQDQHFAQPSEDLLDELQLRPTDRVVEFGCGPGGFTRRILRRLGPDGVVVGVDSAPGLLEQAAASLKGAMPGRFEPVVADLAQLGPWLDGADVVVGRAVLHHIPMAEVLIGQLLATLRPGTRIGFIEPDFRTPVGRLAYLEATGRSELAPLRVWAAAINQLYLARRISPTVGATLAATLQTAGCKQVRAGYAECITNELVIENVVMFYDEVREILQSLEILTATEIDMQQRLISELPTDALPAMWGLHRVTGVV
jgi:trans-aconitate methyltransferase